MKGLRRWLTTAGLLLLVLALLPNYAHAEKAEFTYRLTLVDQNGLEVNNPRTLSAGDKMTVEIELKRKDTDAASYETYGMEFRLESQGLDYNSDGASFRNDTEVTKQVFDSGDSVGFAFYDMEQKGERVNNPVLAGRWSYTVEDPSAVNITVPVALLYMVGDSDSYEPVGNARLFLDPNGGTIVGTDVSGEYSSGTIVQLPDAVNGDYVFKGWSLGTRIFRGGDHYTVTGVTTLVAQWEGLERNRQVVFDPNGGAITGTDPSGLYADGEVLVIPGAERDGYRLSGWTMAGEEYAPEDTYTVDNSVVFIAQWAEAAAEGDGAAQSRFGQGAGAAAGVLGLLFLWWLILLIWRRYVRYSLLDGSVRLSYRDKKHVSTVEVWLEHDDQEYLLDTSAAVDSGEKLKQINGTYVVLGIRKGFYKGRLHVTYEDEKEPKDIKVRIHAKKKEYYDSQIDQRQEGER